MKVQEQLLKVCQISKADSFGGGASRVAEELTCLLNANGHLAQHWASWSGKPFDGVRQPLYGRFQKELRFAHFLVKKIGFPELIPFELMVLSRKNRINQFSIAHFHDISSAISPITLMWLARTMPVIWTVHDCSPFTGGCLYPFDCERFQTSCGQCPQIGTWPIDSRYDFTRFLRLIKKLVHRSGVITVTPSKWMASMAMSSGILEKEPVVINNGVDVEVYQDRNKQEVRRELGIPLERPTILVSAGHLSDPRKGVRYSLAAVRAIADLKPFVIILGTADEKFLRELDGIEFSAPGYVSDPNQLSNYYAAADVFLFSSLADNQPLAVIEAMSSGTPIVGFATGGIPEMVKQGETGLLVSQKDGDGLAQALRMAFTDKHCAVWGQNARIQAVNHFSHKRLLQDHLDLYESLLERRAK